MRISFAGKSVADESILAGLNLVDSPHAGSKQCQGIELLPLLSLSLNIPLLLPHFVLVLLLLRLLVRHRGTPKYLIADRGLLPQ